MMLQPELAERLARMALAGLSQEYPNKPSVVLRSADDLRSPRQLFPVFYGHFDWHSAVHGHWTLVRLARLFPEAEWAEEIRAALGQKFSAEGLRAEADYLREHPSFERMYGWAWALKLGQELRLLDDEDGRNWAKWFRPVEDAVVTNTKAYLPQLDWPIRCGFHPESAFALSFLLDWARATSDGHFENLLCAKAMAFYHADRDYPVRYEPSGNDFFSAGLNEADLMRRVLPNGEFGNWLAGFFPTLAEDKLGNILEPVLVSNADDGHLVHLVGLNLSRAWTMRGIAGALDATDPRCSVLSSAADTHADAGLAGTFSGSYEGEHWLGSFATYLLTEAD